MLPLAIALTLSVGIGVSLGLLGGGGSILTVPVLVYVLGLEAKSAVALSLLVVGTTSLAALIPHARAKRVRWGVGAVFGVASMVGAAASQRFLAPLLSNQTVLLLFAGMMVVTAGAMLRGKKKTEGDAPPAPERSPMRRWALVAVEGLAVGGFTGLVGAGGGFLVVPALVILGRLPMSQAVGTSLLVIVMKSFAAFGAAWGKVPIDLTLGLYVTAAAIAGSVVGGRLAGGVPEDKLKRGFGWFVVVMATFVLWQEVPKALGVTMNLSMLSNQFVAAAVGGVLIGLASVFLLLANGKIAGISGALGGLLARETTDRGWRAAFVAGLALAGVGAALFAPASIGAAVRGGWWVAIAGLIVGFGTRLGSGCTSGHGVCGVSRGSARSLAATATFIATGMLTATVIRMFEGGVR